MMNVSDDLKMLMRNLFFCDKVTRNAQYPSIIVPRWSERKRVVPAY